MASKNTRPLRSDISLYNLINMKIKSDRRKFGKNPSTSRITKAIVNQYKKYPLFLNELMEADLK